MTSFDQFLDQHNLDWETQKGALFYLDGGRAPNIHGLYREEGGVRRTMGTCRSDYDPLSNRDAFQPLAQLVELGIAEWHTVFASPSKDRVLASVFMNEAEVRTGDVMKGSVFVMTGHNGRTGTMYGSFAHRISCKNQLMAIRASGTFIPHTRKREMVAEELQQFVNEKVLRFDKKVTFARSLAKTKLTPELLDAVMNASFPVLKSNDAERVRRSEKRVEAERTIATDLVHHGAGNTGKTAWDLYNGVAEYADHHSLRQSHEGSRSISALTGVRREIKVRAERVLERALS